MNILIIVIVAVVFLLTLIFSVQMQNAVAQTLQIGGVLAQGAFARILRVARWALIALAGLWIANFLLFFITGIVAGAPWSGMFLGILIPIFSFLYVLKGVKGIKTVVFIPWVATCVILAVAVPNFLLGAFSPEIKGSFDNWSYQQKSAFAGYLQKSSAKTEAENSNVIARLAEDTAVYNEAGQAVYYLRKGTPLRVVNFEKYKAGQESLRKVMIRDQNGDFVGGYEVYVPARKLTFL